MSTNKTQYEQTTEFHRAFNRPVASYPQILSKEQTVNRMGWIIEEIVEFLHATSDDNEDFDDMYCNLVDRMEDTCQKLMRKERTNNKLVGQVDALTDMNYFVYGTFTEIGIDPNPIFNIVHQANMSKLFPDGKPHYNEFGKVIKPDSWVAPESLIEEEVNRQKEINK